MLKSGTGTLCLQYNTGGTATIALNSSGLIDIQSGTFVAGGWSSHDWSQNYATLNIGATGTVDHWDGKIIQVGGLTGDVGAKIISSTGSADLTRGGIKIGAGITSADSSYTYNGAVSLTNANSKFIKTGAGTQIITGAFSNSGSTTIESGTLKFTSSVAIGAGGLTVADGAVFDISQATALVVNGTVDLKNIAYTIHSLTGNEAGNITGTGTLTLNALASTTQTYSGIISGDRSVVYNPGGSNILMLPGQSTFTGGLTITNGILRVGAAATLDESGNIVSSPFGTGTVTLNNGTIQNHGDSNYEYSSPTISNDIILADGTASSLRSGWSKSLTISGDISGTGQLQIANDSGTVTLSGANSYSGGTKIGGGINGTTGAGRLILGANNAIGTGAISFGADGSYLDMNGFSAKVSSLSGANATIKNETGTLSTLELTGVTGDTTYSGLITGNVQLVVGGTVSATGSNQLTLSGANTYTGGTTVKDIVVRAGVSDAFDESGVKVSGAFGLGTITLNNGTIQNSNNNATVSNDIVLVNAGSFRVGWSGQVLELSGNISGTGRLDIASDSSSIKISGTNNTYTGGTKIGGGINSYNSAGVQVILGADNALSSGVVSFGTNSSTLQLAGFGQTFGGLDNTNGSGGYYTGNAINNTVDGTATAIDLKLNVAEGGNYAYSGGLPGLNSIVKTGAGKQTLLTGLTVNNSMSVAGTLEFGGTITLNGTLSGDGYLLLKNSNSGGESLYNMNGSSFSGTIELASGVLHVGNSNLGTGDIVLSGGTLKNYSNSPTISNDIILADGTASSLRSGWTNQVLELTGDISGTGQLQIANDSSSVKLSGANNTYSGGTKIGGGINSWTSGGQGTLILGAANALGTGAVSFGANNSTLQLAGFAQTIGGLDNTNGSGGYYSGNAISNSGAALTLTLDVAEGKMYAYNGTINDSDKISVVKKGDGIQKFASSQTFASTTISEGAIMLSGENVTLGGPVTVSPGAYITTDPTDGVYHTIAGDSVGTGKGDLLIMIDSPTEASRFSLDVLPTYNSEVGFIDLAIADGVNLSTSAAFAVSNSNPTNPLETDLENWLLSDLRYEWNLTWDQTAGLMTLQRDAAAIPEPTTWALLILGTIGLLGFSKKRKNK